MRVPRKHAFALGFLALLTILFFSDLIFLGRIWFDAPSLLRLYPWRPDFSFTILDALQKDFTGHILPSVLFMVRSLFEEGVLPLWNPYVLMGVPAFGEGTTKVLSLLNGVHFFFGTTTALNVQVILQVFLCGVFMYSYLYSFTVRSSPALMGAVAFMFSGFILGGTHLIHIDGYFLTPLGLQLVDRAVSRPGFRAWIPVSLVLCGIVLGSFLARASDPLLLVGAYAVFRIVAQGRLGWAGRGRRLLCFAGGILLAVLLSAVELLPFRAILAESTRVQPYVPSQEGFRLGHSLQMFARALLNFFFSVRLPLFFQMVAGNWTYFGSLGLFVLAGGYLLGWRRGLSRSSALPIGTHLFFLGAICLGFFNFYFAPFVVEALLPLGRVPHVFSSFFNYRALFLVAVGFSVLLANGFHVLYPAESGRREDRPVRLMSIVTLAGAIAAAILLAAAPSHWMERLARTHQVWLGILGLGLISFIHLIRLPGDSAQIWKGRAVLVLLFLELWVAGRTLFRAYPESFFYPSTKAIRFLLDSLGHHRVVSIGGAWNGPVEMFQSPPTMNVFVPFGIRTLEGLSNVAPRGPLELLGVLEGEADIARSRGMRYWAVITKRSIEGSPLLDLLGVKYVLASHAGDNLGKFRRVRLVYDDEFMILENPRALPRVLFVPTWEWVEDDRDVLRRLRRPGFDPRRKVILQGDPGGGNGSSKSVGKGVARIVNEGLNHVVVEATAEKPGYVILADAFFPGWRATVDGVGVPIERANHALRAVRVDGGSHRIRFDYWPPGLTPGLWISACTFAGLLLFVGLSAFRNRRPRGEADTGRGIARCLIVFGLSGLLLTQEAVAESPKGGSVATSITGEMVFIPAGRFLFGRQEVLAESRYQPAFYVDKFEVANRQYEAFFKGTHRRPPRYWKDARFNGPNHPVVGVSWFDAGDYCRWAGKRLPSEAEWEKAARGTDGRVCPWGNHDCLERGVPFRANHAFVKTLFLDWFDVVFEADGYRYTAPVGRFPKGVSSYGVHDLAGNVWEWIGAASARRGDRTEENLALGRRLQRGGAWSTLWFTLFTYHRRWSRPELNTSSSVGFRCAKDP